VEEKQLESSRKVWAIIGKMVRKNTNNNPKVLSTVYKTIVLSVLLYGAGNMGYQNNNL
jgi:hypothetical protein